ncbi:uncharacterized protein LOC117241328 [Bombus vosnesenskii]|uniref:Uncharacterized protein LOC117241328 n=1 Tax=Bombus vosnesenskii TaxID=207650 RepID=A0A6J3LC32_9HYME|nr:uncharacterized protein LOC117241328 [Bombus vosnesenskii]
MVHNVFVWQREKTNAVKALAREQCEAAVQLQRQQQLQQHQTQHQLQQQQQLRGPLTIHHAGCPTKVGPVTNQLNTSHATHGRAAQYQHYHHHIIIDSVNVSTALVALIASSDRGDAQSSERERTQKRGYATGYTSR